MRTAAEQWAEATAFAQKHVKVKSVGGDRSAPDFDAVFAFSFMMDCRPPSLLKVHDAVRDAVLPLIEARDKALAEAERLKKENESRQSGELLCGPAGYV